jgi:hypothetical protein
MLPDTYRLDMHILQLGRKIRANNPLLSANDSYILAKIQVTGSSQKVDIDTAKKLVRKLGI